MGKHITNDIADQSLSASHITISGTLSLNSADGFVYNKFEMNDPSGSLELQCDNEFKVTSPITRLNATDNVYVSSSELNIQTNSTALSGTLLVNDTAFVTADHLNYLVSPHVKLDFSNIGPIDNQFQFTEYFRGTIVSGSQIVAAANDKFIKSSDGMRWTSGSLTPITYGLYTPQYLRQNGDVIFFGDDIDIGGISWHSGSNNVTDWGIGRSTDYGMPTGSGMALRCVVEHDGKYFFSGYNDGGGYNFVSCSLDLQNWWSGSISGNIGDYDLGTRSLLSTGSMLFAYSADQVNGGIRFLKSTDSGITFVEKVYYPNWGYRSGRHHFAEKSGTIVAVADSVPEFAFSIDGGETWTSGALGAGDYQLRSVGVLDDYFVAAGDNGHFATSSDGQVWGTSSITDAGLSEIANPIQFGNMWVVMSDETSFTSIDSGLTWNVYRTPSPEVVLSSSNNIMSITLESAQTRLSSTAGMIVNTPNFQADTLITAPTASIGKVIASTVSADTIGTFGVGTVSAAGIYATAVEAAAGTFTDVSASNMYLTSTYSNVVKTQRVSSSYANNSTVDFDSGWGAGIDFKNRSTTNGDYEHNRTSFAFLNDSPVLHTSTLWGTSIQLYGSRPSGGIASEGARIGLFHDESTDDCGLYLGDNVSRSAEAAHIIVRNTANGPRPKGISLYASGGVDVAGNVYMTGSMTASGMIHTSGGLTTTGHISGASWHTDTTADSVTYTVDNQKWLQNNTDRVINNSSILSQNSTVIYLNAGSVTTRTGRFDLSSSVGFATPTYADLLIEFAGKTALIDNDSAGVHVSFRQADGKWANRTTIAGAGQIARDYAISGSTVILSCIREGGVNYVGFVGYVTSSDLETWSAVVDLSSTLPNVAHQATFYSPYGYLNTKDLALSSSTDGIVSFFYRTMSYLGSYSLVLASSSDLNTWTYIEPLSLYTKYQNICANSTTSLAAFIYDGYTSLITPVSGGNDWSVGLNTVLQTGSAALTSLDMRSVGEEFLGFGKTQFGNRLCTLYSADGLVWTEILGTNEEFASLFQNAQCPVIPIYLGLFDFQSFSSDFIIAIGSKIFQSTNFGQSWKFIYDLGFIPLTSIYSDLLLKFIISGKKYHPASQDPGDEGRTIESVPGNYVLWSGLTPISMSSEAGVILTAPSTSLGLYDRSVSISSSGGMNFTGDVNVSGTVSGSLFDTRNDADDSSITGFRSFRPNSYADLKTTFEWAGIVLAAGPSESYSKSYVNGAASVDPDFGSWYVQARGPAPSGSTGTIGSSFIAGLVSSNDLVSIGSGIEASSSALYLRYYDRDNDNTLTDFKIAHKSASTNFSSSNPILFVTNITASTDVLISSSAPNTIYTTSSGSRQEIYTGDESSQIFGMTGHTSSYQMYTQTNPDYTIIGAYSSGSPGTWSGWLEVDSDLNHSKIFLGRIINFVPTSSFTITHTDSSTDFSASHSTSFSTAVQFKNDIEISGSVNGVILTDANGGRWRITVNTSGVLTTTAV